MTRALAIIGAVTGVTGALLALLSYSRDRAKLVVTSGTHLRPTESGDLEFLISVFVANQGRQPIAVTQVGVRRLMRARGRRLPESFSVILKPLRRIGVSWGLLEKWRFRFFGRPIYAAGSGWPLLTEPILLGLGELRKFDLTVAADAFSPDEVGLPLTAFAVDSYDRTVLGTNPILLPSPPSGPLN